MRYLFFAFIFLFIAQGHAQQQIRKGNAFNPDIGFNSLLLYQNGSNGNTLGGTYENGFTLDEAELSLSSDVDTYAKLFSVLSVHKESGNWKIEPEELYAESLSFKSFTLRAGKFYAAVGKYNGLHKHAFPFINQNLINTEIFGDEGFNSTGLSFAYLMPFSWFSEITLQALTSKDSPFFGNSNTAFSPNSSAQVARLRNLFDLSDSLTLEFGVSGSMGLNENDKTSAVGGSDLTFKWRPTQGGKYSALIWSTEYLNGSKRGNPASTQALDICTQGAASFIQWQMAERWWLQGRTEYLDQKIGAVYTIKKRQSALIGFMPTEFSGFRLQYDYLQDPQYAAPDHRIMLQVNLSIGAHPAHNY